MSSRRDFLVRAGDAGYGKQLFLSNDWYFGIAIAPSGSMAVKEKMNPDGLLFTGPWIHEAIAAIACAEALANFSKLSRGMPARSSSSR